MKRILLLLSSILVMFACSKENTKTEDSGQNPDQMAAITGAASSISCYYAELSGKAVIPSMTTTDMSFGVLYSTSSGVLINTATRKEAQSFDSNYNFTITTDKLLPGTTYYYRSYLSMGGIIFYGEVKSFTALNIQASVTAESSNVTYHTATISGKLTVTSEGTFTKSAELYYSSTATTLDALKSSGTKKTLTLGSDGSYSIDLSSLVSNTKYYYVMASKVDDIELKTEMKNFTTLKIQASVTAESSNIKSKAATISGKLTVASEGTFTKSADLYYSSTASTFDALKSSGTKKTLTLGSDGSYSIDLSSLVLDTKYYYVVVSKVDDVEFKTEVKNFTPILPSGAVDLGLSVAWHQCNIGASKPEEYGIYFAWGDVTGQTWNGSSWSGGGFSSLPTYELDYPHNLKPAYDAAHVNLGGTWRMPTVEEFDELKNNCTCTWTDNYNSTGVAGKIFTSNRKGYTDKSIFLPTAGYGYSSYLYLAGSYGDYWSRTFDEGYYAWFLYFCSSDVGTDYSGCHIGLPVRPVTE